MYWPYSMYQRQKTRRTGAILWCISCLAFLPQLSESKNNIVQSILTQLKQRLKKKKNDKTPKPLVVDNFLTPNEASYLLDRYEFLMKDSLSVGYTSSNAARSKYRTSRSVRLPPLGDSIMFDIERRAANLAGFNHSYCEDIQMACYEVGELHGLHRDDADGEVNADRAATVLIYLQSPDGDDGGGETIFTMRELERERDLKTGGPLNTEDGALDLFKSYCDKPEKDMVVVAPEVGRAVTWRNWLGDDFATFAKSSTHGACPVKKGKKCVIQQWIGRKNKLPLRDERVAAIFTAGAALHYRKEEDSDGKMSQCLTDASANEGEVVLRICAASRNEDVEMIQLEDGPYKGVGALRVSGGFKTDIAADLLKNGITISFWARDFLKVGSTIFSIEDTMSLTYTEKGDIKQAFELRAGKSMQQIKIYSSAFSEQWYWFSFAIERGKVSASIYSRGQLDGTASIDMQTCAESGKDVALQILASQVGGGGEEEEMVSDISFVVIHQAILDDPRQLMELGQQAQRYDKNS